MARIPDFTPRRSRDPEPKAPRGGARSNGGRKRMEGHSYISLRLETTFLDAINAAARSLGVGRQQFLRDALAALLDAAESDSGVRFIPVLWWRNRQMTSVILPDVDIARAKALVASGRAASVTDILREAGLRAARALIAQKGNP